jgi:hypothetical protein
MIDITDSKKGKKVEHMLPMGEYEYVDVDFGPADMDVEIPYSRLTIDVPEDVRWMEVSPEAMLEGSSVVHPRIYRLQNGVRRTWTFGSIVLRCSVANYSTRLLLYVERNEASNV